MVKNADGSILGQRLSVKRNCISMTTDIQGLLKAVTRIKNLLSNPGLHILQIVCKDLSSAL